MDLHWYVYHQPLNEKTIKLYDIFSHRGFREDVEKYFKKYKNKDLFAEKIKSSLMYYFWCKSEYEIILTSWPPYIDSKELKKLNEEYKNTIDKYNREPYCLTVNLTVGEKIDIYLQVINNWEVFIEYLWNSKVHRPRKKYGHWVYSPDGNDWGIGAWLCSECHSKNDNLGCDEHPHLSPYCFAGAQYCPHCGLPMKEK